MPTFAAAAGFSFEMWDSIDSAFVRALPGQLSHQLFQRWEPDSAPSYMEYGTPDGDSYPYQAFWDVARIILVALQVSAPDTAAAISWHHADATLEVERVLSLEGDPTASSNDEWGDWPSMWQLVVRPSVDTVTLAWDRRDDGWRRCGPIFLEHPGEPIEIVGPGPSGGRLRRRRRSRCLQARAGRERGRSPTRSLARVRPS